MAQITLSHVEKLSKNESFPRLINAVKCLTVWPITIWIHQRKGGHVIAQTSKKAVTKKTTKAPTVKQGTGLVATVTNVLIAAHPKVLTVDETAKAVKLAGLEPVAAIQ